MKKETKKQGKKTKRKGFEKKLLLTISKVNFEGKGGKIKKRKKYFTSCDPHSAP
jgi:hypothetical protein